MTRTATALAIAAVSLVAAPALAGLTLSGSSGAGWQAFPGTLNNYSNNHRPFWDQDTKDRAGDVTNRNIGNYLNGSWTGSLPSGSAPSPNISPSWWGKPVSNGNLGTMDNNVRFGLTGGSSQVASSMRLEVAGYSNQNTIGWYNTADAVGSETLNQIYSGATSPVTSVTFSPSTYFGLYIRTGGGQIFFSQSNRNRADGGAALTSSDRATQHFAIFRTSGTVGAESYTVGVEDLDRASAGRECVGDYNDLVFTLSAVQIPTPGAAALLGLGSLGIARRRR